MSESASASWEILPRWHLQDLQNPTPLHGSSVGLRRNSGCESRLGLAGSSWRRPARLLQFHPKGAPLCAGPQPGRTSRPAAPERNVGQVHARWRPFPVTPQAPVCSWWKLQGNDSHHSRARFSPTLRPRHTPRPVLPPGGVGAQQSQTCRGRRGSSRPLPICRDNAPQKAAAFRPGWAIRWYGDNPSMCTLARSIRTEITGSVALNQERAAHD
jgi:hypothetical protein